MLLDNWYKSAITTKSGDENEASQYFKLIVRVLQDNITRQMIQSATNSKFDDKMT